MTTSPSSLRPLAPRPPSTRPLSAAAPPLFRPILLFALISLTAISLAACGGGAPSATSTPPLRDGVGGGGRVIEPVESVIAVCPGSTVVIPVEVRGTLPRGGVVPIRFGESPAVRATLVWIGVGPADDPASPPTDSPRTASFVTAWMGPTGVWSATPASRSTRPLSAGTWALVADVPADLPEARTMRIGDWPTPLAVLPANCAAGLFQVSVPTPETVHPDMIRAMRGSPWLARALDAQTRSPLGRWRARLAWRLLDGGISDNPAAAAWSAFPDPIIESLARQAEWRWSAGLARLAAADPALASALAWRLAAIADLGGGVAMPVWPADSTPLARLGEDLLNPILPDAEIALRARAWLDEQPRAVAWVLDDGGASDALTGGLIATLAITNLDTEPAVAWAAHELGPRTGDLTPVLARATARITAVSPGRTTTTTTAAGVTALPLQLQIGDLVATRPVIAAPLPVAPPGLRIGPLLPDWSLRTWLAHGTSRGDATDLGEPFDEAWATVALLYREPPPGTDTNSSDRNSAGAPARWMLYIECARPPRGDDAGATLAPPPVGGVSGGGVGGAGGRVGGVGGVGAEPVPGLGQVRRPGGAPGVSGLSSADPGGLGAGGLVGSDEEVRLWFGPLGDPTALLRISPSGQMVDELAGATPGVPGLLRRGRGRAEAIDVRIDEDRWSAWVPIPPRCIEEGGAIRLGIERSDARGLRTAWPRRMLPWQREPGRAAVTTTTWPTLAPQ